MTAQLVAQHMAALAARATVSIAKEAKTNAEIRNALETMKLDKNTVRIGDFDIKRKETNEGPLFSVHRSVGGKLIVDNMTFYETCKNIVLRLNKTKQTGFLLNIVRENSQYRRLLSDITFYREQVGLYEHSNPERAAHIQNRLGDALARAELLRSRLIKNA